MSILGFHINPGSFKVCNKLLRLRHRHKINHGLSHYKAEAVYL